MNNGKYIIIILCKSNPNNSFLHVYLCFFSLPFEEFASIEATQCTEIYEYAHSLGTSSFYLPGLQLYKYLYAVKLADAGFEEEVSRYMFTTFSHLGVRGSYLPPSEVADNDMTLRARNWPRLIV